ncbi:MAG: RNA polymerase sigma factor [Verrucomicrobiales bacterium]|nr:RNA polymerase sigma factor [Verrucomicrobiales bacterium]
MTDPNPPRSRTLSQSVLEHLVEEHYANLYRFALSLTRNEAEAADLTQQTYFTLSTRGGQIRDLKKAKAWLFTTLRREFLSLRKQSGRFISIDEENAPEPVAAETIENDAAQATDAAFVMEALKGVREVFREPLALFYLESLSYREISKILEVPIGTVMSRLSRGKSELRGRLSETLSRNERPDTETAENRWSTAMRQSGNFIHSVVTKDCHSHSRCLVPLG